MNHIERQFQQRVDPGVTEPIHALLVARLPADFGNVFTGQRVRLPVGLEAMPIVDVPGPMDEIPDESYTVELGWQIVNGQQTKMVAFTKLS